MALLQAMADDGFEQVVHCHDRASGLRAIIAIHSTQLGPALGGTRFLDYPDETAALADVFRLARAMTYKAAAAGLPLGGGKAVIIGDPARIKTAELLLAYGRFVETLSGRYLTAEDVGTTQADMDTIRRVTAFVTGTDPAGGGSGDPSEATAEGVRWAMRAVVGHDDLAGLEVVISGVGKVGSGLARRLVADGATVTVADIDPARTSALHDELGVRVVDTAVAHRTPCDVFSPCALGGALSSSSVAELACRAVVGAANNQLAEPAAAQALQARGIVYAPDFVVNAGGIINIAQELEPGGYDHDRAMERVAVVATTLRRVLERAASTGTTSIAAAEGLARERIASEGTPLVRTFLRS
ncbi:MAG: branched-chain amino acid dehydrogenase [Acidimicrobiales bacterium]